MNKVEWRFGEETAPSKSIHSNFKEVETTGLFEQTYVCTVNNKIRPCKRSNDLTKTFIYIYMVVFHYVLASLPFLFSILMMLHE